MSRKIVSIESDDLGTLYFEANDYNVADTGNSRGSGGLEKIGRKDVPDGRFETALGTIKKVAEKVVAQIRSIENIPDEVECKIGVTFSADANVIFSKIGTECNLELTLKWIKEKPAKPQA